MARSQYIPSKNFMPFSVSNGVAIPNEVIGAEYALTNSDIFSLVHRVSADVAACDLRTDNIQLKTLYKKPNALINGYGFWETVLINLLLNGNAFVVITRDTTGNPIKLEHVPLAQVQMEMLDASIDILYMVNYQDERGTVKVNSKDMLHFRVMPFNSQGTLQYSGISPLTSLATELNTQNLANKLTLSTLKNGINPSLWLKSPAGLLNDEAKEKIRKDFEGFMSGDNSGRIGVLDQSLEVQTVQINADVAKFLSTVSVSQTQISKAFGIDVSYLDSQKGSQQSNIEQIRSLYVDSLTSYMRPIESELEMKFNCEVSLDISSAIDIDNQNFVNNIAKLSAIANPIIPTDVALQALKDKGVI